MQVKPGARTHTQKKHKNHIKNVILLSISILYTIFKIWRSELHSGIQCSFIFESTGSIRAHRSWKVRESAESSHILFDLLLLSSSESDVADFDGRSAILYRFNQKSTSTVKDVISLRFRSHQAEGVLVHGEGQRGDFLTLELQKGRLILHLNLGERKRRAGHNSDWPYIILFTLMHMCLDGSESEIRD